ncbi:MAG: anion permease [Flavobacteriales bacterium]|nr:anion permease [Flavobacteriales bacterium]
MTVEMWFLCSVIAVAVVLFVTERVGIDVTAIFIAFVLMISGLVTVPQGLSGFSNQAALAILALLILNTGLEKTGVLYLVTKRLVAFTGNHTWSILLVLLPFVAVLSAFTNNTAVIALFLPMLVLMGNSKGISPSRLLMPMAFISILGGLCTIIGTSTSLLVNSIARQYDLPPFSFFEFADIGAAMAGAGFLYLLLIGHRLVPARRKPVSMESEDQEGKYHTQVIVLQGSPFLGSIFQARAALKPFGAELLAVHTSSLEPKEMEDRTRVEAGDRLLLRGTAAAIAQLKSGNKYAMTAELSMERDLLHKQETHVVEAVVAPGSELIGRRLNDLDLLAMYESVPLALRRSERPSESNIADTVLRLGDVLLIETNGQLALDPEVGEDLILLDTMPMVRSLRKRWTAVLIFTGVIAVAAAGLVPIVISALGGVMLMAVTKCIQLNDAYKRVEWKVYFLIAGLIPLGIAIQNTGLDVMIASGFISATSGLSFAWVIALMFAFTVIITNVLANNATALLMAPIAVSVAQQMGIDPKALLLTVMFGASTSFFTPVGYHTLTLIYTPGRYKFKDYFVMGLPLTIIVGTIAGWMIWQRYAPV